MKENESLRETLKRLRAGFFYFILFYFIFMGRVGLNLGILIFGLNRPQ